MILLIKQQQENDIKLGLIHPKSFSSFLSNSLDFHSSERTTSQKTQGSQADKSFHMFSMQKTDAALLEGFSVTEGEKYEQSSRITMDVTGVETNIRYSVTWERS